MILTFLHILKKELKIWIRTPRVILPTIFAPLVIFFALNMIFGNIMPIRLGVVNEDGKEYSYNLINAIKQLESPLGGKYINVYLMDGKKAEETFSKEELLNYIIIPEGFSDSIKNSNGGSIKLVINNFSTDYSKNVRLYLKEAITVFYNTVYDKDISIDITDAYSPSQKVNWIQSIAIGIICLSIIIGGMFNGFFSILSEYDFSTLKEIQLSTKPISVVIAAKKTYAVMGSMISGIILYLATGFVAKSWIGGHIWLILLIFLMLSLVYINLGMFLSILIKKVPMASFTCMMLALISFFIGGGMESIKYADKASQIIASIMPLNYCVDSLRRIILYNLVDRTVYFNLIILAVFLIISHLAVRITVSKRFVV